MQKIYDNSTQFSPILDNLWEFRTDRHNIHRQVILYKFSHISGTEPCGPVFYRESHLLHLICTSNSSQDKLRSPPRTKFDMYKVISLLLFILYNTKEYRFSEIPRQPQFVNNVFINAQPGIRNQRSKDRQRAIKPLRPCNRNNLLPQFFAPYKKSLPDF